MVDYLKKIEDKEAEFGVYLSKEQWINLLSKRLN